MCSFLSQSIHQLVIGIVCLVLVLHQLNALQLPAIVDELNELLDISTNIFYCTNPKRLRDFEASYLRTRQPVGQLISRRALNSTYLFQHFNNNLLLVYSVKQPPYEELRQMQLQLQYAHHLLVIDGTLDRSQLEAQWLPFIAHAWQQGYVKLLLHTPHNGALYAAHVFPRLRMVSSTVPEYVQLRSRIANLHGHEVRVVTYNNPPRSLVYTDRHGRLIYGGYYLRFLRHFLQSHNASFVPIYKQGGTPDDCTAALAEQQTDVCSDALVPNPDKFRMINFIRIAYANVLVPSAQPLQSYRYFVAPFQSSAWLGLAVYVLLMVSCISCVHWQQRRRWRFSKFLLEVIKSLLSCSFSLAELRGHVRHILFISMFIAGLYCSTVYLAFLKSILSTEIYGQQIDSFEQLIAANMTLMLDYYDVTLCRKYNLPDILWPQIHAVPMETILKHRNSFDPNYAYMLFTDRRHLFDFVQQYLRHTRLHCIPTNVLFVYAGFPMRKTWFLQEQLSTAWAYAFESGLIERLAVQAEYETMREEFLNFQETEYYSAKPLGLDYFVMPALTLLLGYGLASLSFLIELLSARWRPHT